MPPECEPSIIIMFYPFVCGAFFGVIVGGIALALDVRERFRD